MDLNHFNNDYLNPLLAKLSKEKKTVFLLGDFNADLFLTLSQPILYQAT